jgi:multicomponent K+:H+ antiporter subunit E
VTRWLPFPVASLLLAATWLLLNQSLSPGHLLLAAVFALFGPALLKLLDVPAVHLRRPLAIARLLGSFIADVLRSNRNVVRLILRDHPERRAGLVRIPLRMRSPYGLTALACIITATPGTIWVSYDPDDALLLIHVLDLADDDDWAAIIKGRYERLLMEIFE